MNSETEAYAHLLRNFQMLRKRRYHSFQGESRPGFHCIPEKALCNHSKKTSAPHIILWFYGDLNPGSTTLDQMADGTALLITSRYLTSDVCLSEPFSGEGSRETINPFLMWS